jgi:uncharacterized membrane protein YoaK (UPF0700 family)
MSGNSTQLAVAFGQGDLGEAAAIGELIALFVLGAAAGQALADAVGKWHMTAVLTGVAILLVIAALLAGASEPMVFAMGALNASMHRAGTIPVSLTFVTGVLVRFGQGFGDFLLGRGTRWSWVAQASPWVGMVVGATIGSVAYLQLAQEAIWIPVTLAAFLAAFSVAVPQPD